VELVGAYSNHSGTAAKLADLREQFKRRLTTRGERRVRRKKLPRRLAREEISQLLDGYRGVLTVYELADRFAIHRETVSGVLNREGVPRRRRPLTDTQIAKASALYGKGMSHAQVAAELGCDPSTVWRALAKAATRE